MDYLPIFVATKTHRIVVAGEGQLAEAKCRAVLKTAAAVTLFSEAPTEAMREWANQLQLTLETRPCTAADLEGVRLVYAASDTEAANRQLAEWARQAGAWVNVLDEPEECDFITPAVVDRDPVVVAIGTEGTAPVLARQIKADVEAMLPQHLGRLARAAQSFRQRVSETLSPGRPRRQFWKAFFKLALPHSETSERELALSLQPLLSQHEQLTPPEGQIAFVGAGPGDPELLTMKARRLIHEADVVVYDRLVGSEVLELARREAKFISVGKKGFGPAVSQNEINAHLIREATRGAFVVRLKGGDPGLFGRLDEELEAAANAGITTEVVPGITAASAAAATLQVSLTRRHRNSSTTFLTAHDAEGFAEHEWQQLVRSGTVSGGLYGAENREFSAGPAAHARRGSTPSRNLY
jgi:uroporphyrin-III C-methyltransferase/precorrin-2 dehydrogenase/sirohydrochlorin ferrochelatase